MSAATSGQSAHGAATSSSSTGPTVPTTSEATGTAASPAATPAIQLGRPRSIRFISAGQAEYVGFGTNRHDSNRGRLCRVFKGGVIAQFAEVTGVVRLMTASPTCKKGVLGTFAGSHGRWAVLRECACDGNVAKRTGLNMPLAFSAGHILLRITYTSVLLAAYCIADLSMLPQYWNYP